MYDSRTDATRNIRPNMPTSQHMRRFNDTWMVKGVEVVHPAKPVLTKGQAFHEGWMDLMDVRDEQAIAADEDEDWFADMMDALAICYGYECSDVYCRECEREQEEAKRYSAPYTTETPKTVAVKVDIDERGLRRRIIERDIANGVQYPDLDPYTLEPIRHPAQGKVVSMVRPSRPRYF